MSKVRPVGNRKLIRPLEEEQKGAILIPEVAKRQSNRGKVLGVGPGALLEDGTRSPIAVKKDDIVLYAAYSGSEIELDSERLVILSGDDILAIAE